MTEEQAKSIVTALEVIASRLLFIMVAALVIAGQFIAFNLNRF